MPLESNTAIIGRGGLKLASPDLRTLSSEECWKLLSNERLGRLAINVHGSPRILPVNYAAGQQSIVFRTETGSKLKHGPGSVACFEIDGYDRLSEVGWSVMVVGVLQDITTDSDIGSQALRALPVEPRAPGARLHWLAIQGGEVSGRSFHGGGLVPGGYLG
jgi:uncharacterized protein